VTFEQILERMLNVVPDTLDKREGSVIYLALAPAAAELAQMYIKVNDTMNRTFADTSTGDDLTQRAAERGINRIKASAATRLGVFNMTVPIGSRFAIEDVTYIVTENLADFKSKLLCEQVGAIGNIHTGTLEQITTITGLTSATLTDILIPGEDVETDEDLRKRYFDNLESSAFGGNISDYKEKTKALDGIGGVKVYPAWNGGGTVKLIILDSTYNKPSLILVTAIQTAIDPVINAGIGLGIAPIGHVVTVNAVSELTVNVTFTLTLASGYTWVDVETYIKDAIKAYFLDLKKTWETENALVVRISQLESAILRVTGIVDVTGTKLNGGLINLILTDVQIPTLGAVTNI